MALNALVKRQLLRRLRSPASLLGLLLCLLGVAGFFLLAYRDLIIGLQTDPNSRESASGLVLLWGYRDAVLAVLLVIALLMGVRAVSEEREGRSLDLLFTAPLSRLSFLAAKVGSTMLQISLGLIATMPFVAVTAIMGGVGPWDLFWCFAAHLTSAFFYLVLGWYAGHQDVPASQALQGAYGLVALFHGPVILMLLAYVGLAIPGKLNTVAMQGALMALLGFNVIITISNCLAGCLFLINVSRRLGQESGTYRRRRTPAPGRRMLRRKLWSVLGQVEEGNLLPDRLDAIYARDLSALRKASLASTVDLPSTLFVCSFFAFPLFYFPELLVWFGMLLVWIPNVVLASRILSTEFERETWDLLTTVLRTGQSVVRSKFRLAVRHGLLHLYSMLLPVGLIGGVIYGLVCISAYIQNGSLPVDLVRLALAYGVMVVLLGICSVWFATIGMAASVWTRRQYPALLLGLALVGGFVLVPVLTSSLGGGGELLAAAMHPAFAVQLVGQDPGAGLAAALAQVLWMPLASLMLFLWVCRKATQSA